MEEQSGQVRFNSLYPSIMRDLLRFARQCAAAEQPSLAHRVHPRGAFYAIGDSGGISYSIKYKKHAERVSLCTLFYGNSACFLGGCARNPCCDRCCTLFLLFLHNAFGRNSCNLFIACFVLQLIVGSLIINNTL